MVDEVGQAINQAAQKIYNQGVEVQLSRPDPRFGDLATNVAMVLAKKLGQTPAEVAKKLCQELAANQLFKSAEPAGPGFINLKLNDQFVIKAALYAADLPKIYAGQEILVEFGDPNPFKEMHIGHAYSYIVGDSISTLLEVAGATVHRLSYHGDVGLHVAKAIWGMKKEGLDLGKVGDGVKLNIGHYYALGAKAYETDAAAKSDIENLNQHIYIGGGDIKQLYEQGRQKSLANFELTLDDLGISRPKQYFESQAARIGAELVEQNTPKVFEESDGAVVFKGEKAGLHTRVFITSAGLPTYEAKDLGLAVMKDKDYPAANESIIITAHEQAEYFKVMLAALAEINQPLAAKTKHLYHGFVSLSSGKMSSRTGEVYSAVGLIVDVDEAVKKSFGKDNDSVRNAAIKYGFLKHRLGTDIVYDVAQSVSLEGNSGPYLQYAHARAASVLAKVKNPGKVNDLEASERALALKISEYPEVVAKSVAELMPHHIGGYLYELCQAFNRFYEQSRVIGDAREDARLALVKAYKDVLASGLSILNIEAPEKV